MARIYVASSWRNDFQPKVVAALHFDGHQVYDFKDADGFHWSEIDPNWKQWTPEEFVEALQHPAARRGYLRDMTALGKCDLCVLVMPCGRSAHLEAGVAVGAEKPTAVLLSDGEPELMYRMFDLATPHFSEIRRWALSPQPDAE